MGALQDGLGEGLELRPASRVRERDRARVERLDDAGYCFGGKSKSKSSSYSTTVNTDKRQVVEEGIGVSSDSSTVNVNTLDGGAIAGAFDFSKAIVSEYLAPSLDILKSQQEFVAGAGEQVAKAYDDAKGEGTQKFLLAVGVGAIVAVVAVKSFGAK